jgi:hypothetical protein
LTLGVPPTFHPDQNQQGETLGRVQEGGLAGGHTHESGAARRSDLI